MIGVQPLEVLNWLVSVFNQVLSHIVLHSVPNLKISDTVFGLDYRAELIFSSWDPSYFAYEIGLFDAENLLCVLQGIHCMADKTLVLSPCEHFIWN